MENEESKAVQEMNLQDAISVLLADLPKPVRDFAISTRKDEVALSLAKKYALHADQAGAFQRAYMMMLLGVSSPEDFVSTMRESGVTEDTINGLLSDLNEQIFLPLRKEEQSSVSKLPTVAPPSSSVAQISPSNPKPFVPTPSPASLLPAHAPAAAALPPAVPPPVPPAPAPSPVSAPEFSAPLGTANTPVAPVAPLPPAAPLDMGAMRTMASDMASVRHEGPVLNPFANITHPREQKPVEVVSPQPAATPAQPVPPVSQTPFRAPPTNLPGAPSTPIVKSYSVDPYREPVE